MSIEELILIIDDEVGMRRYLQRLFVDNGYRVVSASNGEQGLEELSRSAPDLVLVDLKMPKVDGIEFLKEAKKKSPTLPIIIMTAYGSMESAIEAMKLGAYDYINKPFDLINKLQEETGLFKVSEKSVYELTSTEKQPTQIKIIMDMF